MRACVCGHAGGVHLARAAALVCVTALTSTARLKPPQTASACVTVSSESRELQVQASRGRAVQVLPACRPSARQRCWCGRGAPHLHATASASQRSALSACSNSTSVLCGEGGAAGTRERRAAALCARAAAAHPASSPACARGYPLRRNTAAALCRPPWRHSLRRRRQRRPCCCCWILLLLLNPDVVLMVVPM